MTDPLNPYLRLLDTTILNDVAEHAHELAAGMAIPYRAAAPAKRPRLPYTLREIDEHRAQRRALAAELDRIDANVPAIEPALAALVARAAELGQTAHALVASLARSPGSFLSQLGQAARPKPQTVARILALIEGRPVPPLPVAQALVVQRLACRRWQ